MVKTLSVIAEHYPQTVYAVFTFCLQNKRQYIQQVVTDTAPFFAPLVAEICTSFLPALLGIPSTEIDRGYCQLLTHSVKQRGLAICNPMDTASSVLLASLAATCHLMPGSSLTLGCIASAPQRLDRWQGRLNSMPSNSSLTATARTTLHW